jgi:hypothetical protein
MISDRAGAEVIVDSFAADAGKFGSWRRAGHSAGRWAGRATAAACRSVLRAIRGRSGALHVRHAWADIEVVGHVHVQECSRCRRTRIRII